MTEESQPSDQLRERVKRPSDAPWSAPLEQTPELFEAPEYTPLEPLEPSMADAIAETLNPAQTPDLSAYFEQLSKQPEGEAFRMPRPPLNIRLEACPEGTMGICINCPSCPCDYLKARVLRALLTELAYGKPE